MRFFVSLHRYTSNMLVVCVQFSVHHFSDPDMQQKSNRLPYLLFLRSVEVFRICANCTVLSRPSTCIWVITEL